MKTIVGFIKRNAAVFLLGLIILVIFVAIILSGLKPAPSVPPGFKKVEETIFTERDTAQPPQEDPKTQPPAKVDYAPQTASPENKGKPYFYGEYNPNLRDTQGYPKPPEPGAYKKSTEQYPEIIESQRLAEEEEYARRLQTVTIDFTDTGFNPTDASAYTGQKVIFANKTNKDMLMVQATPIHEALSGEILIKPGQTFEFRPLINGRAAYVELNMQKYGTLYVQDVTLPLVTE